MRPHPVDFVAAHGGLQLLVVVLLTVVVSLLVLLLWLAWSIYHQRRDSMRRLSEMKSDRTDSIADAERDANDLKTMVTTLLTNQAMLAETVARRALETAGAVKSSLEDVKGMVTTVLGNQEHYLDAITQRYSETGGAIKAALEELNTHVQEQTALLRDQKPRDRGGR